MTELNKVDKIFVINMDRRKDRWFEFFRKAKEAGLNTYEKFKATDGKELEYNEEIERLFKNNNFKYQRGIIGCALSHYRLWKHCYENNINNVLIFEDDVFFVEKGKTIDIWNNIIAQYINEDTEFLFPSSPLLCGILRDDGKQINGRLYKANNMLERTFGYFITLKGIKILLDDIEKNGISVAIDRHLQARRNIINTHVCKVKLFSSPVLYKTDIQTDLNPIKGVPTSLKN